MVKTGEKQWEEFNVKTTDTMKKWVENLEFARKKDLEDLKRQVEILEQRLSAVEELQIREK
jgi:polyhydroxyalkanoate synthesis regulator phasin